MVIRQVGKPRVIYLFMTARNGIKYSTNFYSITKKKTISQEPSSNHWEVRIVHRSIVPVEGNSCHEYDHIRHHSRLLRVTSTFLPFSFRSVTDFTHTSPPEMSRFLLADSVGLFLFMFFFFLSFLNHGFSFLVCYLLLNKIYTKLLTKKKYEFESWYGIQI